MEQFKSFKMLIVDHYDSIINKIDVHTEELLEKYANNNRTLSEELYQEGDCCYDFFREYEYEHQTDSHQEIIEFFGVEEFKNPYKFEYKYDSDRIEEIKATLKSMQVQKYIETIREKAIELARSAEKENLRLYEENKEKYKSIDLKNLTDEKIREIRSDVFRDRFCFVIKIRDQPNRDEIERILNPIEPKLKQKRIFKLLTIVSDFYLDEVCLKFIELM